MNSTPLKDLCLVEWLDDENDSSSASSSEEVVEARETITLAAPLASTKSRDLYDQRGRQEIEVIVISSGEESSDVEDDEAEDDARHIIAEAAAPSELLLTNNNNSNLLPASFSARHATPPAECRLPVELNGIFATAINKLQDPNTESIQSVYQTLAFIEQQDERDRQRKSSTLSGIEQQIAPLQRVDSGMAPLETAITTQGEPEEMDISLNCRSLEEAELDRSRAAMVMSAARAAVEEGEGRERQENLQHEGRSLRVQLDETIMDTEKESQAVQGVLRNKDKIKPDRIVRLTKKQRKALALRSELSGRSQLLNMRSQFAAGQTSSRALDSNSKTKLARRNKQVRRNKFKQKKQNRAAASRT